MTPSAGCEGRAPGFRYCEDKQLLECDADSLEAAVAETCADRCEDGACRAADCGPNLLFSCQAGCTGTQGECYDLCGALAASAQPPLLDLAELEAGASYSISLPTTHAESNCQCTAPKKLAAFAYRVLPPSGDRYVQVAVPAPWQLRAVPYEQAPGMTFENGCAKNIDGLSCVVLGGMNELILWFSTDQATMEPLQARLLLGSYQQVDCNPM